MSSSSTNEQSSQQQPAGESSSSESNTQQQQQQQHYFCHQCQRQVDEINEDQFTCGVCGGGFLEVIEPGEEEAEVDLAQIFAGAAGGGAPGPPGAATGGANVQAAGFNDFAQLLNHMLGGAAAGPAAGHAHGGGGAAASGGAGAQQPFQQFLQTLITNLGNVEGGVQFQMRTDDAGGNTFQFMMPGTQVIHGDPRDYAWGAGGLDQIVTQLLNQFEGGQPPMDTTAIERLPTITVTQEQMDKSSQCTTCFDDFTVGEQVRQLPCRHIFHNDCIVPWLHRHGTCPICRQNVVQTGGGSAAADGGGSGGGGGGAAATASQPGNTTQAGNTAADGSRNVMEEIDELD